MIKINIPSPYQYFLDLVKIIQAEGKLPIDEINLVGGRKSGKTTTVELFFALLCLLKCDVGLAAVRNMVKDAEELQNDFTNTFDAYQIDYNILQRRNTVSVNGTDIRILGVNSNSKKSQSARKAGLAKFGNVKYIIVFFEERFEFNELDVKAVKEAIRTINPENNDTQYLYINACNPWAKSSEYISYCASYQGWNVKILKETGSQIKQVDQHLGNGLVKRALFHYTNWRVAKQYLGESEIKNILDTWQTDPKRAATVDYGLPGYELGAIYTDLLNNLGKAIYQEHTHLLGGIDIGWGTHSSASKTVAHFIGWSEGEGMDLYGEYVQDNRVQPKAMDQIAREIVEFYYKHMSEYCSRNGWAAPFPLKVRVDNMSVGVIALLNTTARTLGVHWLKFIKCCKFPVNDRIEITRSAMYRHQIRLADNVTLLKQEMELATYEVNSSSQKRTKENDHSINAFEYAIEPIMGKIARENKLNKLKDRRDLINYDYELS